MALNFAGVTTINGNNNDPGTLNKFMQDNYLYDDGCFLGVPPAFLFPGIYCLPQPITSKLPTGAVRWELTVNALNSNFKFDTFGGYKNSIDNPQDAYDMLDHFLCADEPHPVIVGVRSPQSGKFPGHYVLVIRKEDRQDGSFPAKYFIQDPAYADPPYSYTSLDDYVLDPRIPTPEFETRGAVVPRSSGSSGAQQAAWVGGRSTDLTTMDAPGDLSSLNLDVGDNADLLVIAPTGQRTAPDSIPLATRYRRIFHSRPTSGIASRVLILARSGPPIWCRS
jgi:hypothetical protein